MLAPFPSSTTPRILRSSRFALCFIAAPKPNAAAPRVDSDSHCSGGDEDRHLPPHRPEADPAGPGEVPATESENALPHQGRQPGTYTYDTAVRCR